MNSNSLSKPRVVLMGSNYSREVDDAYNETFSKSRLFGKGDLEYNGKKIIFDNQLIDEKHERFWHLISFDPQSEDDKFSVAPCNNMDIMLKCLREKTSCDSKIVMPFHYLLGNRVECYYRMIYLPWIDEIIELANQNDQRIQIWEKKKKNKDGPGYQTKVHIRFQDDNADYLIVLNDLNSVYKFITAFPISILFKKKDYSRDYKDYKRKTK